MSHLQNKRKRSPRQKRARRKQLKKAKREMRKKRSQPMLKMSLKHQALSLESRSPRLSQTHSKTRKEMILLSNTQKSNWTSSMTFHSKTKYSHSKLRRTTKRSGSSTISPRSASEMTLEMNLDKSLRSSTRWTRLTSLSGSRRKLNNSKKSSLPYSMKKANQMLLRCQCLAIDLKCETCFTELNTFKFANMCSSNVKAIAYYQYSNKSRRAKK